MFPQDSASRRATKPSLDEETVDQSVESRDSFARSVADGLSRSPPSLDYRLLYDAEGSRIFERITGLSEYYPTRTEASILKRYAAEIARLAGHLPLVEFGAGSGSKTSLLIEAFEARYGCARYLPVDVSRAALEMAVRTLSPRHRLTRISPVQGLHSAALSVMQAQSPALGIFLGSSIGNFTEEEERLFFAELSTRLQRGGTFLMGVDLVKDPALIERAYNDRTGVTASFVKNLFQRIGRELGAEVEMSGFGYEAKYNERLERVEIHARFDKGIRLALDGVDRAVEVGPGVPILVEICRKFRLDSLEARLRIHGLEVTEIFLDDDEWFADLLIARRRPEA